MHLFAAARRAQRFQAGLDLGDRIGGQERLGGRNGRAPGLSSSPVETTGTINTEEPAVRLGSEVATVTAGAW